ncbi:MAG: CPBP family intramembrane glutamic endopeptidase [Patescibacteria group bacterium]|jgi:hypothetical protein
MHDDDDDNGRSGMFLLVFFGLIAAYAATGLVLGLFSSLARDLTAFSTGSYATIAARDDGVSMIVANAMTMAVITLPLSVIPTLIVGRLIRRGQQTKKPAVQMLVPQPGKKPLTGWRALIMALHKIAAVVFYEEFYTRWIFLGVLASLAWFQGPVAFYTLFFIGNGAWALVHLTNYPAGARNPLRILPHFFLGIPMTIMFLRYGLLGAFIGHFLWNMIPILPAWIDQIKRGVPLTLKSSG